jgi:hypothetical protein
MHILAYIDPGTGALIWQSIVAAFIGTLFYLKRTRKWIGGLFRKASGRGPKPGNGVADVGVPQSAVEEDRR